MLNDDLRKAIEANLSAQVAGVLLDYLKEAEENKQSLKIANEKSASLSNEIVDLGKKLWVQTQLEIKEKEVNSRLKEVEKREFNLELEEAKIMLTEANKRTEEIKDLVRIVFSNPKTTESRSYTVPVMNSHGNYVETHSGQEYKTIETKKD